MSGRARGAWLEESERHWHNPSGLYREAGEAKQRLEFWRETLADHFGIADPERVVFTSGATEANNAVIRHLAESTNGSIAVSEIEHPCVEAAVNLCFARARVRKIPVDRETGAVDRDCLKEGLARGGLGAVSVMAANNETGALQPWRQIADRCGEAGIPFHTDAAQWIGKLPVNDLGESAYVTGSAHKFGGGKGVGFLILPGAEESVPFHGFVGGPQEHGRRAGTENLPGVAAMVSALVERTDESLASVAVDQARFRDAFEARMQAEMGARIIASSGTRLWNTSLLVLPHSKNLKWLSRLSQRGVAVSTGSACSAGKGNPSAVMMAMGLDYGEMGRVLRVSGGWETGAADWEALAAAILETGADLSGQ